VPHYKEDLMAKVDRVRKVIVDLPKYGIPEINDVSADDYKLIKLSIINSIKGEQIAHEERSRQDFVVDVYLEPARKQKMLQYEDLSQTGKCDFVGTLFSDSRGKRFGLEVKGGEGNSVTLLDRPRDAETFVVWSHLDVMSNTPAENMRAVLGRVVKQMINADEKRQKVDFLVFYDEWYRNGVKTFREGKSVPDVFVFPSSIPTKTQPHPTLPSIEGDLFLTTLFKVVGGIGLDAEAKRHIWYCDVRIEESGGKWFRKMKTYNAFAPRVTFTEQEHTTATCKPTS
jgi:hypothetical protein